MSTVLFSGRFCRPHCGHIRTIQRLGQVFDRVVVVVLDYPEQRYPSEYRREILDDILQMSRGNYVVTINKDHFATISAERLAEEFGHYEWEVYASGNDACLKHIAELGYKTLKTQRSWDYEAHLEG